MSTTYHFYCGSKRADEWMPKVSFWKLEGQKRFRIRLEWRRWCVEQDSGHENPRKPSEDQVTELMRLLAEKIAADKDRPL